VTPTPTKSSAYLPYVSGISCQLGYNEITDECNKGLPIEPLPPISTPTNTPTPSATPLSAERENRADKIDWRGMFAKAYIYFRERNY
jgi:hypothetical protein